MEKIEKIRKEKNDRILKALKKGWNTPTRASDSFKPSGDPKTRDRKITRSNFLTLNKD